MENFRQQFLLESVETLELISQNLRTAEDISESSKREIFRKLHTVKGTAQTFGFSAASRLAHELENLLAARADFDNLFLEGLELLINSLKQKDFEIPKSFAEKTNLIVSSSAQTNKEFNNLRFIIPNEFTSQLTTQEKIALQSALQNEKNLFCFEIVFELKNFADELINFREILNNTGEIIATLPSSKFNLDGKIGFQILFASTAQISTIAPIAEQNGAEIIFDSSAKKFTDNNAASVLSLVVEHGKDLASKFGKQIKFEIFADEIEISSEQLKIIFDALLHLVRNAVDHAIESTGKVKINLTQKENDFLLTVSDDGRGIDTDKLKTKAFEKNLITDGDNLSERELIDFIFQPEFSTKSEITETSGRGIGLDAVKSSIEKLGGTINVTSAIGKGTMFEIFLPQ